ncbi:Ras-related GTP binding A family protein [Toxoplasma gondii TgCatPRC2]|uniref:Ras-related GTP binding A family protein n=1 Tax=Toxoplasma gondii TgCatPRC2 TaxID=1130821 RepID=A0A151HRP0_TOXGO|nr:Ras-related GTP binding A family protein [Toxoplasma gondii TgCatPRC2]
MERSDSGTNSKLLLMGRAGAGKSSMRSIIFANYIPSETQKQAPTSNVDHSTLRFLGWLDLSIWDCGGQDIFMENYFELQRENIFGNAEVLVYVLEVRRSSLLAAGLVEAAEAAASSALSDRRSHSASSVASRSPVASSSSSALRSVSSSSSFAGPRALSSSSAVFHSPSSSSASPAQTLQSGSSHPVLDVRSSSSPALLHPFSSSLAARRSPASSCCAVPSCPLSALCPSSAPVPDSSVRIPPSNRLAAVPLSSSVSLSASDRGSAVHLPTRIPLSPASVSVSPSKPRSPTSSSGLPGGNSAEGRRSGSPSFRLSSSPLFPPSTTRLSSAFAPVFRSFMSAGSVLRETVQRDVRLQELAKDARYISEALQSIWVFSPTAKVFVLVHKMDIVPAEDRPRVIAFYKKLIRDLAREKEVGVFATSIWEDTLFQAWSTIVASLVPHVEDLERDLRALSELCVADEIVLFEKNTFLVISHWSRREHPDAQRFEKVSSSCKQFKMTCAKSQSNFSSFVARTPTFSAFIERFTRNTYIMIIISDPGVEPAATLCNIDRAREHFSKSAQAMQVGPSL